MLEVRHLIKTYKPKKGKEVKALNDVSIKFPEKGLVFILGKSGCGKSTLLNMLGGLDRVDSGEIIIKGKSSKDFTQADFDSYRNTYLGFIFQEYNILNEFTVGANVALAIELQGKKATKEAINDILQQVDLVDYANRKPNQLSGGQKQRVAIARALVKNPEIILADEPTGALDSKTGIQVFDTLKELARNKLVIVVSHDREFAESYGDRVIELKDGKIISDIEKYTAESQKMNDSIAIVDDKIIQITQGYELTKDDVKMINEYLKQNNAIISIDDTTNRDLKKFARIDDSGNKECFKETNEDEIVYERKQHFKLIKSRLPFKDSFKMGASGLKAKPFRLFISILLSLVAFTLFGLADTINAYNKYTVTEKSLIDSGVSNISFIKEMQVDKGNYISSQEVKMTQDDINKIESKTGLTFRGINSLNYNIYLDNNVVDFIPYSGLYVRNLSGYLETTADAIAADGFTIVGGKFPTETDEIAISKYTYELFKKYGYKSYDSSLVIKSDDDRIKNAGTFLAANPTLRFGDSLDVKIVGVIDTKFDYNHFEALDVEDSSGASITDFVLLQELNAAVLYGYHGIVFVKEGFKAANYQEEVGMTIPQNVNLYYEQVDNTSYDSIYASKVISMKDAQDAEYDIIPSTGASKVEEYDIMIQLSDYVTKAYNYYINLYGTDESAWPSSAMWCTETTKYPYRESVRTAFYSENLLEIAEANDWVGGYWNGNTWEESPSYSTWTIEEKFDSLRWYLENLGSSVLPTPSWVVTPEGYHFGENINVWRYFDLKAERAYYEDLVNGTITMDKTIPLSYKVNYYNNVLSKSTDYNNRPTANVVGIFLEAENIKFKLLSTEGYYKSDTVVLIADSLYEEIEIVGAGEYAFAIAPMNQSKLKDIVKWSYNNAATSQEVTIHYELKAGPTEILNMVNSFLEELSSVFLWVGLGFAVFAGLLMMNYIATTISYKKREIGILRAVGARSADVFSVFFNESLIIAFINFVLSAVATFGLVFYLNSLLRNEYNITLTILNFGIRQVGLILVLAVGVAALASAIPVFNIARKKPIDAIRSE